MFSMRVHAACMQGLPWEGRKRLEPGFSRHRHFNNRAMLATGRLSVNAVRSCCQVVANRGLRHAHAKCLNSVHTGALRYAIPTGAQMRQLQWRCHSSKVKNMPDKQLENTKKAASAAENEPAANDHYDKILEELQKDSEERMGKAVSVTQEALRKTRVRGIRSLLAKLNATIVQVFRFA